MLRRSAALALLLAPSLSWAGKKPLPPPPASYLYNEGVVSASAADRIGRRLRGVEEQTGHQFVVALFQSLEGESLEDYSNRLFRAWAPGAKKKDDGLLLALFKEDRRWRVEVGYGLEGTLTDLEASEIARDAATGYLKAGDYDTAVFAAVDGLASKLGSASPAPVRIRPRSDGTDARVIVMIVLGIILALYILSFLYESAKYHSLRGRAAAEAGLDVFNIVFNILLNVVLSGGGGSSGGGGFSGGGGSSGGGGASGDW